MKELISIIFLGICLNSFSQNFEKTGKDDLFKISGGLGMNIISRLDEQNPDPINWIANGNLVFTIMDLSLPISFTYSDQRVSYTQPFNQFSLQPSYKWIKTKIGYTSMNFSNYTLGGHPFLGAGIELSPGNWKINIMYGRLNKQIEFDPILNNENQFSYYRIGYGIKTGYETEKVKVNLISWRGKDEKESVMTPPMNSAITPKDNFVTGLSSRFTLYKYLFIEGELASSLVTENTRIESSKKENPLDFEFNESTDLYFAYNSSVGFEKNNFRISIRHEHIDPGYRSLGTYFINNDFENLTINSQFSLFGKKLNCSVNSGIQRNNLDNDKNATTSRLIGNLNLTFQLSTKFFSSLQLSNFSTITKNKPIALPSGNFLPDTMNFYQVTRNASFMSRFQWGNSNSSGLMLQINYNQSQHLENTAFEYNLVSMKEGITMECINSTISYNLNHKKSKTNLNFGFPYNQIKSVHSDTRVFGPSINLSGKIFGNKFIIGTGSIYNLIYESNDCQGWFMNHKINLTYKPVIKKEAGSFNLGLLANYLKQESLSNNREQVNIFLNLNYSF